MAQNQQNNKKDNGDGEETTMVDITSMFASAAESLSPADAMICDPETFHLQDAMAALELMDHKMDCCEVPWNQVAPLLPAAVAGSDNNTFVHPRPAPTGLKDRVLGIPWDDVSMEDCAIILVEILVRLESLMSGASVVESTFTCLYTHRPVLMDMRTILAAPDPESNIADELQAKASIDDNKGTTTTTTSTLQQSVIYTASLLLLGCTDMFRAIVINADIYEEEDFTLNTYGIPVIDDRDNVDVLVTAEKTLEHLQKEETENSVAKECILHSLRFMVDLLKCTTMLAKLSGKKVLREVQKSADIADRGERHLKSLLEKLPDLESCSGAQRVQEIVAKSFDSFVNRPLFGNAPVRKVTFPSWTVSLGRLARIAGEIQWAVCGLIGASSSLRSILQKLHHISTENVNILSRSLMVLNLYFDDKLLGQRPLPEVIQEHIESSSKAPKDYFTNRSGRAFLNQLAKPLYDRLKLLLLNRNRQRAYMEAVNLPDWASLQQESQIADISYRKEFNVTQSMPPHFSLFVLTTTLELMDHFVSLGIELGLFHGHRELASAYWYRDFLLASSLNHRSSLHQIKQASLEEEQRQAELALKGKGKKKGGKHSRKNQATKQIQRSVGSVGDEMDVLLLSMKRHLCRGTVRFIAALYQAGVVADDSFKYTSHQRIFEMRFQPFAMIHQPPPLFYNDFVQGSDFSGVSPQEILDSTVECFTAGKHMCDKLLAMMKSTSFENEWIKEEELQILSKVCLGNIIYVQKLKQAASSDDSSTKVEFDKAHDQFCIIKLT